MMERRKVHRRICRMHMCFPAIDHGGNIVMSDRRRRPTRRAYDISVRDADSATNLLARNRQATSGSATSV